MARRISERQSERAIAGILFDLDETLYSREVGFWSWIESEARYAGALERLDREKIADLDRRGRGDKERLLEYLDSVLGWGELQPQRLQRFRAGIATAICLAPGVRPLLERLGERYRVGLVTNGSSETQRAKLLALGLTAIFDPIVISEEVGFRKPDVRIFELALAGWHLPPESVLFVGDDPVSDIEGAEAAGMWALQVGHEHGIPCILELETYLQNMSP